MIWLLLLMACVDEPPSGDGDDTAGSALVLDGAALQAALDQAAQRNDGWGGVTLRVDIGGGVAFEGAAGAVRRDGPLMATDVAYEIASVTKSFTAALVLTLVEEGRFGLDDPIGPLLGPALPTGLLVVEGVDLGPTITVRQLLQQDSGLPDYWSDPPFVSPGVNRFLADFLADGERHWSAAELLAYVPDLNPIGRPGARWHYSDSNFVLLGVLAERVVGAPYHVALRERVLDPLGLADTWMVWEEPAPAGLTLASRYEGRRDLIAFEHQSADWAGGGLASTSVDLVRFARGLEGLLNPELLGAMMTPIGAGAPGVGYGLGLFLVDLGADGHLWGHDGYGGAFVYSWPEQELVMAGTINQTGRSSEPVQGAVLAEVLEIVGGP
jgi:D-alanyl-D-alanine carboxypeptidase